MLNKLLFKNSFEGTSKKLFMIKKLILSIVLSLFYFSCTEPVDSFTLSGTNQVTNQITNQGTEPVGSFTLSSSSFTNNGALADKYAAIFDGIQSFTSQGVSPQLSWVNPPTETRYYTLTMVDTTSYANNGVHWAVYNIPVSASNFAEGFGNTTSLTVGTHYPGTWTTDYVGPWPPMMSNHNYVFTLYALDSAIAPASSPNSTPYQDITNAIRGKVVGTARLTGTYTGR